MAQAMKGLRVRPRYEQLISVSVSDGLEHIKFPNRDASFPRLFCFKPIRRRRDASNGIATTETH